MDKKAIRKEVSDKKKQMSTEEIESLSLKLKEKFCNLNAYKNAEVIYAYMSYNQEVRTNPIIEQAWADGKKVAVPKTFDKEYMEFMIINSLDELELGYCDIPEPVTTEIADFSEVLILMPGLAFDSELNRIGYGGGFYDKYLSSHDKTVFTKIALCFDFQIYKHLEVEEHDEKMDVVVTPSITLGRSECKLCNM